jgi:uncharacterized protein (DUF58 family)
MLDDDERTTLLTPRLRRTAILTAIIAFSLVSLILGVQLLFLITLCLILLWMLAYAFAQWSLRPLQLEVLASPEVVEGQETPLRFRLTNTGRLPRWLVEARFVPVAGVVTERSPQLVFGQVPPHQTVETVLPVRFQRRGLRPVGTVELWAQDPFGLFTVRRAVSVPTQVLVYPQPRPTRLAARGANQLPHWEEAPATMWMPVGGGVEVWGVRPYQPGDPLRHIHWKVTAHRGNLFVWQTVPTLQQGCTLVLDRHPLSHIGDEQATTLDDLVRVAAFLVREWLQQGYQVRFWAPPEAPIEVTDQEWHAFWRRLALLDTAPYNLPDDFAAAQGAGVILTTALSPFHRQFEQAAEVGWLVWRLPWQGGEAQ